MIRAIYRDGAIQPLDEVPGTWQDGQELVVAEQVGTELRETIEQWAAEMDAAAALSDEDHDKFMAAIAEHRAEAKKWARREMGLSE
jgi:hypothetical protein